MSDPYAELTDKPQEQPKPAERRQGGWIDLVPPVLDFILNAFRKKDQEEEPGKPMSKSKTMWANILAAVAGVAGLLGGGSQVIAENPEYGVWGMVATAGLNILLRFATKEPVQGV